MAQGCSVSLSPLWRSQMVAIRVTSRDSSPFRHRRRPNNHCPRAGIPALDLLTPDHDRAQAMLTDTIPAMN